MQYTNRPSELYVELATPADTDAEKHHSYHGWCVRESRHHTGHHHTIVTGDVTVLGGGERMKLSRALGDVLAGYLTGATRVLVCGLGNAKLSADRLGPAVVERLGMCGMLPGGRCLYGFIPGVPAVTGIATDTLVRMTAQAIHADRILAVDALCASCAANLVHVVQCTDTGLTPGSGISESSPPPANHIHQPNAPTGEEYPPEISTRTMPCPVVTAGVPTVIRTTLPQDDTAPSIPGEKYLVTPGTIDRAVECWSAILSAAILQAVLKP